MKASKKINDKEKTLADLIETMIHRHWLIQMGLIETHDILLAGSDFIYG